MLADLLLSAFGASTLFDPTASAQLLARLCLNLLSTSIVVGAIYVRRYRWNDHAFTYIAFNLITFCLCFLLTRVPVELGFALGLFAVFGVLRYRTEPIRTRDLTYLFIVIGLAILNAVTTGAVSLVELLLVNAVIVGATAVLELGIRAERLQSATIDYDNLALLQPGNEQALRTDLLKRTSLLVTDVEVRSVDLVRSTAVLTVSFRPPAPERQ